MFHGTGDIRNHNLSLKRIHCANLCMRNERHRQRAWIYTTRVVLASRSLCERENHYIYVNTFGIHHRKIKRWIDRERRKEREKRCDIIQHDRNRHMFVACAIIIIRTIWSCVSDRRTNIPNRVSNVSRSIKSEICVSAIGIKSSTYAERRFHAARTDNRRVRYIINRSMIYHWIFYGNIRVDTRARARAHKDTVSTDVDILPGRRRRISFNRAACGIIPLSSCGKKPSPIPVVKEKRGDSDPRL